MAVKKKGLWNRLNDRSRNGRDKSANFDTFLTDMEDEYPNLRQFLQGIPPDCGYIEGGTVQLFCDHQTPKIRLCDRHNGNVAFLTGLSLGELLRAAEDGLKTDSIPWRPDQYKQQKVKPTKG